MAASQDSLVQLYAQLGQALNMWSFVEDGVATVFLCAISARKFNAAQAAFAEIISFDGKLSACDAAISSALSGHQTHLDTWIAISKKLRKKKQIRNKLAHFNVLSHKNKGDDVRLFPYMSSCAPSLPDWNGGWSAKTISGFYDEFKGLNDELTAFIQSLAKDLDMWPTVWRPPDLVIMGGP